MFCQQALSQLAEQQAWIEEQGWRLVLVHLGDMDKAAALHQAVGLENVEHVSDPHAELYRSFQLGKSTIGSMMLPNLWKQSFLALKQGYRQRGVEGDALQLPGAFVVSRGAIVSAFRSQNVYEAPDLKAMAKEVTAFG